MIIGRPALPRRTFLRGVGASLALPLLDAMVPRLSAATPVTRLGFVYFPMGAHMPLWKPSTVGRLTELSPTLSVLAPCLDHVTVISNLELKNAYSQGNHATANCTFLAGVRAKPTDGPDYELGTTADQLAAHQIGRSTPLPSLELATDFNYVVGNCDNGYACVYMNTLSWTTPTTPLPTEANPRVVFERMFGEGGTLAERRAEIRRNASILDWVRSDVIRLQGRLGAGDRTRVSQYLDSVREIERRIQQAERQSGDSLPASLERPIGAPVAWEDHARLMFDLQVLALQADITRVITFQLAREVSTRTYPQIGVSDAHHPLSHHGEDQDKLLKLSKITAYHVSLFSDFLQKLRAIPDGDGSLLDHSLYLMGSGLGNSDRHDHSNLPILVAGGAMGAGRHISYQEPTPLANVLLTMLHRAGVDVERFADSSGVVSELV
jgi:hypothetical protein